MYLIFFLNISKNIFSYQISCQNPNQVHRGLARNSSVEWPKQDFPGPMCCVIWGKVLVCGGPLRPFPIGHNKRAYHRNGALWFLTIKPYPMKKVLFWDLLHPYNPAD